MANMEAQREAATFLVYQAEYLMDRNNGARSPHPKIYHTAEHAIDVSSTAYEIGVAAVDNLCLPDGAEYLAAIAGAYHDLEQDSGSGENERLSAEKCKEDMARTEVFQDWQIQWTAKAILATQVRFDEAGVMHQSADEDDYLSMVVADADLSNLGKDTEEYWEWTLRLFREQHPGEELNGEALDQFAERQVNLLNNHIFYTAEAYLIFPNQAKNRDYTMDQIELLKQDP